MKSGGDADKRQTLRCVAVLLGVNIGVLDAGGQARAKLPLIGILDPGFANDVHPWLPAFTQALAGLGWVEGRTVALQTRYADNRPDRMAGLAREIVGLKPDLIFTHGGWGMLRVVTTAAGTIPIVVMSGELVPGGFAKSLARPGGNVTGMSLTDARPKQFEILKDAVPSIQRIGALMPIGRELVTGAAATASAPFALSAQAIGLQVQIAWISARSEIVEAIVALKKQGAEALLLADNPMMNESTPEVVALALQLRLASISQAPGFADAGGLLQFGADVVQLFRGAAGHADRILRGARPEDLPIEEPTKYELVVNLKTAKALGLKMPPTVLARADRIVE